MADSEVKVLIAGEAAGAVAAMQQAAAAVTEGVAKMRESLATVKESFSMVSESIIALGALAAGGGIFRELVNATNEWTESSIHLGIELGIATEKASIYHVAIREVGGTTQDFDGAIRGLTRQIRTHEKALNDMGIATRDSAGKMLEQEQILWNSIDAVNQYKEGTDRNLAAQVSFGRGVSSTSAILRLHKEGMDEATDTAANLSLTVGEEAVAAFEKNRKSLADISLTFESLKVQLGNEIIPVLVKLASLFQGDSTEGVNLFGEALRELASELVTIIAAFELAYTAISGFGNSITAFLHGELDVASQIEDETLEKLGKIVDEAGRVKTSLAGLMGGKNFGINNGDWGDDNGDGGEWGDEKKKPDKKFNLPEKKEKGPDSRLQEYKNALEQMSQAKGDFDKKDIAADLQYWQSILANTTGKSKEDVKLRAEIEKEILALRKKAHDEDVKSQEENIKTIETLQLGEVEVKKQALVQQAALGKITNQEELQGEIQLENQKYAIEQKAINDKLKLAQFDQLARQKLQDQELVLEQKHTAAVQKLNDKLIQDEDKHYSDFFKTLQSGFQSTIAGFLSGTTSLGNTIKSFFMDIGNAIIGVIAQMAAEWAVMQLKALILGKVTATSQITANAGIAATAAMASVAAIPLYGWAMAPEVGAATFGDAMGYLATASAAGGYDIPGGINPVTQLHAQEMVLPAPLANAVRNMAGGGGGGGDVHIHAIDAHSFVKWSRQNNGAFGTAMKSVQSRFGLSS